MVNLRSKKHDKNVNKVVKTKKLKPRKKGSGQSSSFLAHSTSLMAPSSPSELTMQSHSKYPSAKYFKDKVKENLFSKQNLKTIQDIHEKINGLDNIYIKDNVVWTFKNGKLQDPQTLVNFLLENFATDEKYSTIYDAITETAIITAISVDLSDSIVNNISFQNKLGIVVNGVFDMIPYSRLIFNLLIFYISIETLVKFKSEKKLFQDIYKRNIIAESIKIEKLPIHIFIARHEMNRGITLTNMAGHPIGFIENLHNINSRNSIKKIKAYLTSLGIVRFRVINYLTGDIFLEIIKPEDVLSLFGIPKQIELYVKNRSKHKRMISRAQEVHDLARLWHEIHPRR